MAKLHQYLVFRHSRFAIERGRITRDPDENLFGNLLTEYPFGAWLVTGPSLCYLRSTFKRILCPIR